MLPAIKNRRSVRQYLNKSVEEPKLTEILKAAMTAPCAHNERNWEFIIIKNNQTLATLAKSKRWIDFLDQAPVAIVLCSSPSSFWIENLAMVAENIYLEATNQGLATCFVQIRDSKTFEGPDAEDYIKQLLSIPQAIRVLAIMPLGYAAENPPAHSDADFSPTKIHHEKW